MRTSLTLLTLSATALLSAGSAPAQVVVPLGPRGAFIRTNSDAPTAPAIRTLTSLGVAPGDLIRIRVLGEFTYNTSNAISRSSGAVFSSSDTLLATSLQARVPGAIDAGVDVITGGTYYGSLPTDVPEDFRIGDNVATDYADVIVPAGAVFLFIGVLDSLYNDNNDTDNDFAAEITVLCSGGACCDTIDFNGDGLFPDTQDIDDFLSVFAGGPCPTGACGDIDFNNDGLFPDTADIDALLSVFSGGQCV
ncbi:MAG TPA: hypothetical protein VHN77_10540 [Phycisphaerales bacterium]|nr:hypothetical protein [Phycisphaerales bacterium]